MATEKRVLLCKVNIFLCCPVRVNKHEANTLAKRQSHTVFSLFYRSVYRFSYPVLLVTRSNSASSSIVSFDHYTSTNNPKLITS
jgi:hypothetical protein